MICKFCNEEFDDDRRFCPHCGKRADAEEPKETQSDELAPKKSKGVWKLVLAVIAAVAVVATLTVVGLNEAGIQLFPANDIYRKDSYMVSGDEILEKGDTVVAELHGNILTNALLQVFYMEEIDSFLVEYYDYIGYLGLDLTKPLNEQTCYFDKTVNWEQFMVRAALESWQSYVLMGELAKQDNFTMDAQWQESLDKLSEDFEKEASKNNFENADAMLKAQYGETCNMSIYKQYVTMVFTANAYYSRKIVVADDEIEAYFTQHENELAEKGITKASPLVSDVRHILVCPEGGTKDEQDKVVYTEKEWSACLAEAEKILNEWKNGDATEESFQELVSKYTEDTASKTTGGLYQNIANDETYEKAFRDWAIDTARKTGDTEIVKTSYGYHIMYYVKGEPQWIHHSREQIQSQLFTEIQEKMDKLMKENPANIKYNKIGIQNVYA